MQARTGARGALGTLRRKASQASVRDASSHHCHVITARPRCAPPQEEARESRCEPKTPPLVNSVPAEGLVPYPLVCCPLGGGDVLPTEDGAAAVEAVEVQLPARGEGVEHDDLACKKKSARSSVSDVAVKWQVSGHLPARRRARVPPAERRAGGVRERKPMVRTLGRTSGCAHFRGMSRG